MSSSSDEGTQKLYQIAPELVVPVLRNAERMSFASRDSILLFACKAYGGYRDRYRQMFADLPVHVRHPIRLTSPHQRVG